MDGLIAGGLLAEEQAAPYLVAPLLTDHLDTFASAPEGFKRLRELVLNLAVRGRLVDQTDEETALRIGSKTLPAGDTPFGIPASWRWARIGEVLTLINGRAFKPTEWLPSGLPIVRIQNLNNEAAPFNYCIEATVDDRHIIDDGAFLISWSGTPGTSFGAFIWVRGRAALNQHIFKCEFASQEIDPAYLRLAINGRLDEMIAKAHGGVGLQHITKGKLEHLALPLPPLAEQSRIVAKVEELMALIDRLEAKAGASETVRGKLLDTLLAALADSPDAAATADAWAQLTPHFDLLLQTPADVDRLQQTLLQLAFQGKLVHANDDEWMLRPLGSVVTCLNGFAFKSESFAQAGLRLVRNINVSHGHLDWAATAFVGETVAKEADRFRLYAGDIVLSLDRPVISTGLKVAVIRTSDEPCLLVQRVARLSPRTDVLHGDYLLLWLKSPFFTQGIDPGRSNGIPHISTKQVEALRLPVPSLDTQSRIVAAVASLTALCDRLRERLAARRALSARLAAALTESALA